MEKVANAQLILVEYVCDECQQGLMRPNGVMLMSNPPQYPHQCTNCGSTKVFYNQYPYQKIVATENLRDPEPEAEMASRPEEAN